MSGEATTLLDAVRRHAGRPLVLENDRQFTASALCDAALEIRTAHPELASAAVALQFSSTGELLIRLLALDGFARRIVLLPLCLSGETLQRVLRDAGATHLYSDSGVTALEQERSRGAPGGGTEWLFTTSGTSGEPKLFSHTLRSLMVTTRPARSASREYRWGLAYQPHRFAGIQVILQALTSGSPLVLPPSPDITATVECFARHRVNTLSATPSQWRNFLSHGGIRLCKLEQITLGGEIADQAILSALARAFPGARIVHIYASTEAGVGFSVTDGQAGFPAAWLEQSFPCELKISDSGSLLIRSPALSHSETLHPRLTDDGYLDTEDRVEIRQGRVHFLGRATGIINVGGNKVHPEEIENLVRELPDVQNALVSGRSSPIMGQLVALEVQVGELSAEESRELKRRIREHCRKHLPDYKVPALINIVQELAVAESGKIQRKQTA